MVPPFTPSFAAAMRQPRVGLPPGKARLRRRLSATRRRALELTRPFPEGGSSSSVQRRAESPESARVPFSVALHLACGFRVVGTRERIGQRDGVWRDVLVLERRAP